MSSFGDQVAALAAKYRSQMRAVMRTSVQETVTLAQQVDKEGGRMRVDTGFLRASIGAAVGQMPVGESDNPNPPGTEVVTYMGQSVTMALLTWEPPAVLYVGWTANYARAREHKDGFLQYAVDRWPTTVEVVTARIRQRMK